MTNPDLSRCDAEVQLALEAVIAEGEPIGAYIGYRDWQQERRLIEEQCE